MNAAPRRWLGVAVLAWLAACAAPAPPPAAIIEGEAVFREPVVLPPGAFFEATLEDVSRAGAPSLVLARTRVDSPRPPAIRFSLAYDPAQLRPGARYMVRARVMDGAAILFIHDTPALFVPGDPAPVRLVLRRT